MRIGCVSWMCELAIDNLLVMGDIRALGPECILVASFFWLCKYSSFITKCEMVCMNFLLNI